jgi:hypothetical protein
VAEEDEYPAGTTRALDEQAQGQRRLQIYPGAEHVAQLMRAHPDLIPLMLDWLHETLQS